MIDCIFPISSDDDTLKDGQVIKEWSDFLVKASENLGRPLTTAKYHKEELIRAGFENVRLKHFKWPTNRWPKDRKNKEVGLWTLANIDRGLEGLSMALLTRGLGWTKEEVVAYLPGVRKDLRSSRIHAYWPMYVTVPSQSYMILTSTALSYMVKSQSPLKRVLL